MPINTSRKKITSPATGYPEMFKPDDLGIKDEKPKFIDYNGTEITDKTCSELYDDYFANNADKFEDYMTSKGNSVSGNIDISATDYNAAYKEWAGNVNDSIGTLNKSMVMVAMSKTLQSELNIAGIGVSGQSLATELTIETSLGKIRSEGLAKFEWLSRILPDAITIIQGIIIGAFPFFIIMLSFMSASKAWAAVAGFFMGYIAISFNTVSLALVQNIISYYTSQHAQEAISAYAGIPFGMDQISDYMIKQAEMAGLAGLIGSVSVFAVTPLILKGESSMLTSALGSIQGAFSGNIDKTAHKTLADADLEAAQDAKAFQMTEEEAAEQLSRRGIKPMSNMTALQTYSEITRGHSMLGAGRANRSLYNSDDMSSFERGSEITTTQSNAKMAGLGSTGSVASAQRVSFQDGEVSGFEINATDRMRNFSEKTGQAEDKYNEEAIGTGMAASKFAKDMGMQITGSQVLDSFANNDATFAANNAKLQTVANSAANLDSVNSNIDSLNSKNAELSSVKADLQDDKARQDDIAKNSTDDLERTIAQMRSDDLSDRISGIDTQISNNNSQIDNLESQKASMLNDMSNNLGSEISNAINSGNTKEALSSVKLDEGKDSEALASLVASSQSAAMSQIAAGKGLLDTGAFDKDNGEMDLSTKEAKHFLKGTEGHSAQKFKQTEGFGAAVDTDAALEVAKEDGEIAGHKVNKINAARNLSANHKNAEWSAEDIASGQAIKQVEQEMSAIGANNAHKKENKEYSDSLKDAFMGAELDGRISQNSMIGKGKEWTDITNAGGDIKLMSKVQSNEAVKAIGSIEATNAEIQKHKDSGNGNAVDGAIKDMITGGQEKGIMSATHSANLREK